MPQSDRVSDSLRNQARPRRVGGITRRIERCSARRWQRQSRRPARRVVVGKYARRIRGFRRLVHQGAGAPFTVHDPESALKALADHGDIPALMRADGGNCEEVLRRFAVEGIDIHALARKLQNDAAQSFVNSWNELMRVIASRSHSWKSSLRNGQRRQRSKETAPRANVVDSALSPAFRMSVLAIDIQERNKSLPPARKSQGSFHPGKK